MARVVLQAAKCSQMTNPRSGTGSGGDRCTEATGAMIDGTYKVSSWAKAGFSAEYVMFKFTESLNAGSDVSAPEGFSWFTRWLSSNTHGQITVGDKVWPQFDDVVNCINRGHIAAGGFDDYTNLRLKNGGRPWPWSDPHGLGHVLLIVGYDRENGAVVVHDPLRADPTGQPADYAWTSFVAAGFHDLMEVHGPALSSSALPDTTGQTPTQAATTQTVVQIGAVVQFLEALAVAVLQLVASYFTKGRLT